MTISSQQQVIVLFDGFCNLCSRSVDFIMKNDTKRIFRYVALQSDAGIFLRTHFNIPDETDSVILWQNGRFYFHSEAALKIATQLRFPWPLFRIFLIVPVILRDAVYRWIARNRYRWFGKRESCRMPTAGMSEFFVNKQELLEKYTVTIDPQRNHPNHDVPF